MTHRVTHHTTLSRDAFMARLIKRYENRKLYDTEASSYVSLSDVADLVRQGVTVRIEDNATGRDLTAQTLTQIILEEGKNGDHIIPSDLLHDLLRQSSEAIDSGFEQLKHSMDDIIHSSMVRLNRLVQTPQARELKALRQQLQDLEAQLADLIQQVDEHPSHASTGADDGPADQD
jgi:polyhydroxyalkanoate synthesis repressor PhaR